MMITTGTDSAGREGGREGRGKEQRRGGRRGEGRERRVYAEWSTSRMLNYSPIVIPRSDFGFFIFFLFKRERESEGEEMEVK